MACSSGADDPSAGSLVSGSTAALTDPDSEPELTDPVPDTPTCVIQSTRDSNVTNGPWSFRFLVEQMARVE